MRRKNELTRFTAFYIFPSNQLNSMLIVYQIMGANLFPIVSDYTSSSHSRTGPHIGHTQTKTSVTHSPSVIMYQSFSWNAFQKVNCSRVPSRLFILIKTSGAWNYSGALSYCLISLVIVIQGSNFILWIRLYLTTESFKLKYCKFWWETKHGNAQNQRPEINNEDDISIKSK